MEQLPSDEALLLADPRVSALILDAVEAAEARGYARGFQEGNQIGYTAGHAAGLDDGYNAYEADNAYVFDPIPDDIAERNRLWAEYNLTNSIAARAID